MSIQLHNELPCPECGNCTHCIATAKDNHNWRKHYIGAPVKMSKLDHVFAMIGTVALIIVALAAIFLIIGVANGAVR
jgi:hypothetical protein